MIKILIVEDNQELSKSITDFLLQEDFVCETTLSYLLAKEKLKECKYDIVLLDIMLPDGNGLNLLQYIKEEKISSGVLIISAKGALEDRIHGLDLGADDYLTKPFHLAELNARIKAIHRRKNQDGLTEIVFGKLTINTQAQTVRVLSQELILTKKEYALLIYFINNKNRMLSKQSIAEHVWGDYVVNLLNFDFVYQHVKNLRKKLIEAIGEDYIETFYGLGYKMKAL